jgi:hypothetical protein
VSVAIAAAALAEAKAARRGHIRRVAEEAARQFAPVIARLETCLQTARADEWAAANRRERWPKNSNPKGKSNGDR